MHLSMRNVTNTALISGSREGQGSAPQTLHGAAQTLDYQQGIFRLNLKVALRNAGSLIFFLKFKPYSDGFLLDLFCNSQIRNFKK